MKVRRVYDAIYESIEDPSAENLIWVLHEDLTGMIHYQFCSDGTCSDYQMTPVEFLKFQRVYA